MKKLFFLLPMIASCFGNPVHTQTASITLSHVKSCNNTTTLVPANVVNFLNVGAMSLDIAFDTLVCKFQSLKNIHPQFSGLLYNVIPGPQTKLRILYSNLAGANLAAGKIFDIEFLYVDGQTNLQFLLNGCELTTPNFQIIPTTFINGSVKHLVTIDQQPVNQSVHQPNTATFSVVVQENPTFQWQQSFNNGNSWANVTNSSTFQGATTSQLSIFNTSTFFNGRLFRCLVTNEGCPKLSNQAILTVLPPLYDQTISLPAGWSSLSTYLDPLESELDDLFSQIDDELVILITGSLMYYPAEGINTIGTFDPQAGYSIKLSEAADLTITGTMQTDKTIEIPAGWSYLPVINNCETSILTLFGAAISQVMIIKEIAGSSVFWPGLNITTLTDLIPGRAYMVNLTAPAQVTFPGCK
ncbi:MAG: hypothetical protein IH598_01905 [Bacteroidales bacterium]|nr:hypothetical protein [Bacteroidales bacterium]